MPTLEKIEAELTDKVDGAVSALVARKGAEGALDARKLNLADDAASGFRELCREVVGSLQERSVLAYNSDAELTSSEVFVLDDAETLGELADLRELATLASTLPETAP